MRAKLFWGNLASLTFAAIVAVAFYLVTGALITLTTPKRADANPPDCTSEEIALALAQGTAEAKEQDWLDASQALADCELEGGPCTQEEIDEALAWGAWDAAEQIVDARQEDLDNCLFGP